MINRLVNLGVTDSLKVEEVQLVRLTNVLALVPVPVYLFYIGYGFYFDQIFSSLLASTMILLTGVSVYQNFKRRYGLAKLVLIWLNGFSLWITYHVFNIDYAVLTGFLPLLVCYAFFFDIKSERTPFLVSLGFTLFFLTSSGFLPRQVIHTIDLAPEDASVSNIFHLTFSFLLTIFLVFALFRYMKVTSAKLIWAREEAERYSKLQSEFLANMSHEILTPLNGLIGSAHLLKSTKLTEEQLEYAETIGLSSNLLKEIIDNVLDMSRLEADKLELEKKDFDLCHTLKGVIMMLKPTLGNKPVALSMELDKECCKMVNGDEKRIRQVVSNLVGNAIKFTGSGEIVLSLRCKKKSTTHLDFDISVRDTGIGITQADQQKLFTRFYQVQSSANRMYQGTGLGLVICKSLVELMGGRLTVSSEIGKGTAFTASLRLGVSRVAPKAVVEKVPAPVKESLPLNILIAEDNEVNQVVLRRILSRMDYSVDLAMDGNEAYEMATTKSYDMVLMDIQMPDKDGIEATKDIRKKLRSMDKPLIVALTANAQNENEVDCLKAGMNDYLTKPVSVKDIEQLIDRWF